MSAQIAAASLAGASEERTIAIFNIHTKETASAVYKRDGQYVPEALQKINHVMRDWRRNQARQMDPALIDLMWEVHRELGSQQPIHLVSGYRSPGTNESLRRRGGGQARNSRHITGQAADIHFPDVSVKQLRNSALIRERGGVGYYPTSHLPFVHVDTGHVRHWPRLPRQELAILFPSGQSKHAPRDGRPLTKADFRAAMAKLQQTGGELPVALQKKLKPSPSTVLAPVLAPVLASLGPPSLTFGLGRDKESSNADAAKPGRAQSASLAAPRNPLADGEGGAALQPRGGVRLKETEVAHAPDYDEEHPDELYYQPFPVLPLMSEAPLTTLDLSGPAQPVTQKAYILFAEPHTMLALDFQPGLQYAKLYWASRFSGKAVAVAARRSPAGRQTASGAKASTSLASQGTATGGGGPTYEAPAYNTPPASSLGYTGR